MIYSVCVCPGNVYEILSHRVEPLIGGHPEMRIRVFGCPSN